MKTILLSGAWQGDYLSEMPELAEPMISPSSDSVTTIPVPGYWEDMSERFAATGLQNKMQQNPLYTDQSYPQTGYCSDLFLPNRVGCLCYTKTFLLNEIPKNPELSFGGAQNTVSAWLNGHYLGRHEGYSAPFCFPVPQEILSLGENRVTLAVSNYRLKGYQGRPVSGLTSRAANECTGGIYGDVAIISYPDGLRDLWVTVSEDCESITVHTEGAEDIPQKVEISDNGKALYTGMIPAGSRCITVSSRGLKKWSPELPKRYQVTVSTPHQSLSRLFGVRRLTVSGTKLFLNGEPWYFRGICEHCYQYATVHPTREKSYYIALIQKLKSLGFNAIRFHTWIPPYEYMEAADELGMVLEVETPNNTAYEEWKEIVRFCRRYTSVNLYSTGNELQIDNDYEIHLRKCADLVHKETDALFSPMSAMRGIEYMLREEDPRVEEPFLYNPTRLTAISDCCDLYNSYSLGFTSYDSSFGTQEILDRQNAVYGKPLLSHEICIQGTYIDLSLEERYQNTRIGKTQFMSSVRTHLADKGLIDKAETYYENSVKWQSLLRKQCFELVRRCHSFGGYDFLGDIDTHWHTFGYCVGMMNEFYELKPGETTENVLRYNSPTVLLADLPRVNYEAGEKVQIPLWVSHYGEDLEKATLHISVSHGASVLAEEAVAVESLKKGELKELHTLMLSMPLCTEGKELTIEVALTGQNLVSQNRWQIYVFPEVAAFQQDGNVEISQGCSLPALLEKMAQGKTVVIFGTEPFASVETTFQLSIAGRTTGHLATAICPHPLMVHFPHQGFCAKQFEGMLNGGRAAVLDGTPGNHNPIIDIATTYKNAQREGLLFEYCVEKGRLLVCTLNFREDDPAARWLKAQILSYAESEQFTPAVTLTAEELRRICQVNVTAEHGDSNRAVNKNDITAQA